MNKRASGRQESLTDRNSWWTGQITGHQALAWLAEPPKSIQVEVGNALWNDQFLSYCSCLANRSVSLRVGPCQPRVAEFVVLAGYAEQFSKQVIDYIARADVSSELCLSLAPPCFAQLFKSVYQIGSELCRSLKVVELEEDPWLIGAIEWLDGGETVDGLALVEHSLIFPRLLERMADQKVDRENRRPRHLTVETAILEFSKNLRLAVQAEAAGNKNNKAKIFEASALRVGLLAKELIQLSQDSKRQEDFVLASESFTASAKKDPIGALELFRKTHRLADVNGSERLQQLLSGFAGFKFSDLASMRFFADRLKGICQSFEPPMALFINGQEHIVGNLRAVQDKGYFYFRVRSAITLSKAGASACELPQLTMCKAPADGRRRPNTP